MELNWKFLLIFFGLFIVMFLTQNFVSSFIYKKAIFKKETMNTQQLYEEPDKIKRRLRILFAAYICIIVVLGTSPITLGLFLSVAITFDLIIFLYSLKLARKEKSIK